MMCRTGLGIGAGGGSCWRNRAARSGTVAKGVVAENRGTRRGSGRPVAASVGTGRLKSKRMISLAPGLAAGFGLLLVMVAEPCKCTARRILVVVRLDELQWQ